MLKYIILFILWTQSFNVTSQDLYPYGEYFTLGLYSLHSDLDSASYYGWNNGHRYGYFIDNIRYLTTPMPDFYFQECNSNELYSFARLSWKDSIETKWSKPAEETISEIYYQAKNNNISWWDIPEELRYWKESEYAIVKNYTNLIREYDHKKRPTYMYIPGHYSKENISYYVPFLDIIPASCYPRYQKQPHVYVRWSIERTKDAIIHSNNLLGKNYLNNEKTIIAILELFETEEHLTAEGTWHDFWLSIACDVKGIQVFSHFYRNNSPSLSNSWNILNKAIEVFKEHRLDQVIISGSDINISHKVLHGPHLAPQINIQEESFLLPSLKILAKEYLDTIYIIAVNSSEANIVFQICDIPPLMLGYKEILKNNESLINNKSIIDTLNSLETAIYKIYTDNSEIKSTIFPNPATNNISVLIDNSTLTFNQIKVFNKLGVIIEEHAFNYCSERDIKLNLKKGIYIVQLLRNNECIATNKLIISD